MTIEENVSLSLFTTFHIGGPAKFLVRVTNREELTQSLDFARDRQLAVLVLGGGSNILVPDAGFDGLVIKIEIGGITREGDFLIAGAGEPWDALVGRAIEENLWGIENLSGIPGTVGGAVAGNIGAYGQALSQTCVWADVLDAESGKVMRMHNIECRFGYRESFFSSVGFIVLRAAFTLSPVPQPNLLYKDLKERFAVQTPSLAAIREAILAIRGGKFPDLSIEGAAGSFFKNPIVSAEQARMLGERYPQMPTFALPETAGVKIPLAWLLDHVLHLHGARVGGARLYEKQPLVIVAEKNCTSSDVRTLAEQVHTAVKEKIEITIEPEVKIIF